MRLRWDIFCRVVDNFGDAGVCWRLARQLAHEHDAEVRLWIDDVEVLGRLYPAITAIERQHADLVEVRRWPPGSLSAVPADIVIEAFGCGLPEDYVSAMADAVRRPLWIVLEYLSAEAWVSAHHELASPHPRFSLERYFFFPGFVEGTGGLLLEGDLFARRGGFGQMPREAFWRSVGHEPPAADATTISMFAYDSAPLSELLRHWEQGPGKTVVAIPESALLSSALGHFGTAVIPVERVLRRRALEVRILPFVPQARYDELLWSCDCNFVRGEDSFVRALWAARPAVWHIYPQKESAHRLKLEAFLELYGRAQPARVTSAVSNLMLAWNQFDVPEVTPGAAWDAYAEVMSDVRSHADEWAARVASIGGLVENLVRFCRDKLK